MVIRKIKKEEIIQTKKLSSLCFEYPFSLDDKSEEEWLKETLESPPTKEDAFYQEKWGAFDSTNDMMSSLAVLPFNFSFDGNCLKGTGIGNVCTYPHHRGKGAIKEIFQHILPDMYKRGIAFSYLYPFSESFYRQYGYSRLANSTSWSLNLRMIPEYNYDGSFHLYTSTGPIDEFKTAYEHYATKLNMMVLRDQYDWDILKNAKAYYNNNYAYLYKDKDNKPVGYIIFKTDMQDNIRILNCSELVFDSFATLKALMSLIRTYAADYRSIHFSAPKGIHLEHFCKDYSAGDSHIKTIANGMVRVVHVEEVLKSAIYRGSGSLSILINDKQIEENNRVFTVTYENNKAIQVLASKDYSADIEMPIDFFSTSIVGYYDSNDFDYIDHIVINCPKTKLEGVFFKKLSWINNYF